MGYEHRYVFGRVVGYIDHRFVSGKIPYVSADVVIDAGKLTVFPDNLEVFNCAVRCPGMLEPEYEDDTGDFFRRVSLEDVYNWACTHAAKEKSISTMILFETWQKHIWTVNVVTTL